MKVKLGTILITAGIIIWLSIVFFIYSSRYSSEAQRFSFYSEKNYKDYDFGPDFRELKSKLTLILLKNDVFGYYENSKSDGKIVSIDKTDSLIQGGLQKFSKDSLEVIIKYTKEATYKAMVYILDKISTNQIQNYTVSVPDKNEKKFLRIDE